MQINSEPSPNLWPLVKFATDKLVDLYFRAIRKNITENPTLRDTIPGFLLQPSKLIVYVGKTHLAIEYEGAVYPEPVSSEVSTEICWFDYTESENNLLEQIVGFPSDSTTKEPVDPAEIFFSPIIEELFLPTHAALDILVDWHWDFAAQDVTWALNMPMPTIAADSFTRLVNCFFFGVENKSLVSRRIKWLDFIPLHYDNSDLEMDRIKIDMGIYEKLARPDSQYSFPIIADFKLKRLQMINRFIEVAANSESSETEITNFLAQPEHSFLLMMRFGASQLESELTCVWQSEERPNIRPDFFIVQSNGFANIVEFKLPKLKRNSIVGKTNREAFSSEISSYIAQTRVYRAYFDDPNNRKWFEEKYGFKVYKPKRFLVMGRRSDFSSEYWQEIRSDYRDIEILTYDDLVDGVIAQFYH